ncbi:LuxR family transcriptional regulator [Ornithinimicrobium sp. Y1847]|uniref:LuxR family transcriptional regulator n=1 Tax=Ornithinimicrobium sp. Y1847 TaxID=3405419 RepID=UPI003B6753A4
MEADRNGLEVLGLSEAAETAYLGLLRGHGTPVTEQSGGDPSAGQVGASISADVRDELVAAGLVTERAGALDAISPRTVLSGLAARRQDEVMRLLAAAEELASEFERRPRSGAAEIESYDDPATIVRLGAELVNGAREVVRGLDRAPYFADVSLPDSAQPRAQARGVTMRIIYEGESLRDAGEPRPEWADGVAPGEEARILPRLPMKLLVADRSRALIGLPTGPGRGEGVLVHGSLLLDSLIAVFDQLWEAAIPLDPGLSDPDQWEAVLAGEVGAGDRRLLALLGMGLTDEAIGRDQGVSARTVQRRLSVLQKILGVETRFQLGVQAARRGWL